MTQNYAAIPCEHPGLTATYTADGSVVSVVCSGCGAPVEEGGGVTWRLGRDSSGAERVRVWVGETERVVSHVVDVTEEPEE